MLCIWVDNIIITTSSLHIDAIKQKLTNTFKMTDLGEISYILSIQVIQN